MLTLLLLSCNTVKSHKQEHTFPKTDWNIREHGISVVEKSVYIIRLDRTICISLKTVRGAQLSIVGSLFTLI